MIRFAALFAFALLPGVGAPLVHADLVVQQHVDGGGQQGDMTVKIKGTKSRADLPQPVSVITDSATGDTILLRHNRKTFTRIPASQVKALTEQLLHAQGDAPPPKLQSTGKKEAVNGHQAEIYDWNIGAMKMKFWIANDFPNVETIKQQLDALQHGGLSDVVASMMPKSSDMPGIRVKAEIEMPGHKVTYTISSIKEEAVDPGVFEIPKDYTEAALPLPGAEPD